MDAKLKKQLIITFFISYLAYISNYLIRQTLSVSGVALVAGGFLDEAELGILGNVFFWAYAFGRFFGGPLSDRVSPHLFMGGGMIIMAVSMFLFGRFFGFAAEVVLWGVNALAQSMLWGSVLRTMHRVLPEEKRTKYMAVYTTCIGAGMLVPVIVCPFLEEAGGVQLSFTAAALYTLVMAAAFMLTPATHIKETVVRKEKKPGFFTLIKDPSIRETLIPAAVHGLVKDNVTYWASLYFVARFGIDIKTSLWFVMLIPLLAILGRLSAPLVIRLCGKSERKTLTFCFIGIIVGTLPALILPGGQGSFVFPLLAALGLGIITMLVHVQNLVLLSEFPMRYGGKGLIATVSGVLDLFSYVFAGIGTLTYGFILKYFDFFWMFLSWIVLAAFAAVYLLFKAVRKPAVKT